MLGKGKQSVRVLGRALILQQLDQGQRAAQMSSQSGHRRRYEEEDFEHALYE